MGCGLWVTVGNPSKLRRDGQSIPIPKLYLRWDGSPNNVPHAHPTGHNNISSVNWKHLSMQAHQAHKSVIHRKLNLGAESVDHCQTSLTHALYVSTPKYVTSTSWGKMFSTIR
uniref:Uncharacterized protein n=1 Tax=Nelumbo nucifera TaxID=4432 RepID=A0A822XIL5_NELNU|nr:TPA_asm: hypothetical protein HUJ06_020434 [Nelumbo nucifera]